MIFLGDISGTSVELSIHLFNTVEHLHYLTGWDEIFTSVGVTSSGLGLPYTKVIWSLFSQ